MEKHMDEYRGEVMYHGEDRTPFTITFKADTYDEAKRIALEKAEKFAEGRRYFYVDIENKRTRAANTFSVLRNRWAN